MAGLLSGLSGLGLGNLEGMDLFSHEEKEEKESQPVKKNVVVMKERDFIYDKSFQCPVCDNKFTSKVMKTGKAKLIGSDFDLRPRYEGIDAVKYDAQVCPVCGYAALGRYFPAINTAQAKLIREQISLNVVLHEYKGETYSYDDAMEMYKLCLANAVVKRAKNSEKAYICLKTAWLLRGYQEELMEDDAVINGPMLQSLKAEEDGNLMNALNGFTEARSTETFPMCGMDTQTVDYLLAQLNYYFKKYDIAARLVSDLLASKTTKEHIKDKARDLKEQILAEVRKSK